MFPKAVRENLFIILLLSVILAVSFYDVVFLGKTFKLTTANPQALTSGPYGQENNKPSFFSVQSTDAVTAEEPLQQFIKMSFQNGIIPLWNPHQGCGYPLIGTLQAGLFSPLNFIRYLFPEFYAWDLMTLTRFFLSGLFTYWFMRRLRYSKTASLVSAVVYMLSGPMILLQYNYANIEILTPLLLLSYENLIRKPCARNMGAAALVMAVTCFSGHPEHVFLVNAFALVFFAFRTSTVKPNADYLKVIYFFLGAALLAVGFSAIVVFPFLQNWLTEFWHGHTAELGKVSEGKDFLKETLLCFFFPHFFQKEPVTLNFGRYTLWGHLGIFSSGLAFLSLFSRQRQRMNWFFAFMLFALFGKSFLNFFVFNWIGYLPLFRYCRFYFHSQFLFVFCLSVLAGMGIRAIEKKKNLFLKGLLFVIPLLALAGWSLAHYHGVRYVNFQNCIHASQFGLSIILIFQGFLFLKDRRLLGAKTLSLLLLLTVSLELFLYIPRGHVRRFHSFPKVPYIEYLKNSTERARAYGIYWTFYPDTASGYQVDDLGIEEGLLSKRFVRFTNELLIPNYFTKNSGRTSLRAVPLPFMEWATTYLDLLNVKYIITPKDVTRFFGPKIAPHLSRAAYDQEVKIYTVPTALPRAFIVHRAIFEPNENSIFPILKRIRRDVGTAVVIHHQPVTTISQQLRETPLKDNSKATLTSYTPNEVLIEADLQNAGFLVLGDTYHPDWKAFIDGKESKIYIADYLLRAVFLQEGKHTVRFIFSPIWFYRGAILSLLSLLAIIFFLWKRPS